MSCVVAVDLNTCIPSNTSSWYTATSYCVIGLPPLDGLTHETLACLLPGTIRNDRGGFGAEAAAPLGVEDATSPPTTNAITTPPTLSLALVFLRTARNP